jgi:hypothetical protein
MTDAVKRTRRYDSPHRREQADSTRRHILDTARRLFEADGYSATSMTATGGMLRLKARNSRAVKERAGAMMKVISSAAAADADARALWDLIQSDFHQNQATVVESLAGRSQLLGTPL